MPKLTYTVAGERKTVDVTDSCSIGRLDKNTIALPDEEGASRHHCQIMKISSGFELTDLGSTNGTKINGQKVKRHKLKGGDRIQIGATELVWDDGSGGAAEDEVVLEGDVELEEPAGSAPARSAAASTSEQCYLVFAGGPKDGQRIALEKKRLTFGRNAKNTFVFDDDNGVSGYHCEVAREGGAYVLRDLGSTNGTLVDGEQVTEIALQHGNRIRIGGQRLVFVDPTVSDFEKAMSAVDDLGSEWGLLRAEMDMSRVQQARRSQMIGIAFAAILLVGGGYVAMNPGIFFGQAKPLVALDGNQLTDFSFEGGTGSWVAVPGSPVDPKRVESAEPAAQGKAYYQVTRDGPTGRGAAAASGAQGLRVNPTSAYAFGAQVRTSGDAQACVRVTWIAADEKSVVGESATDLASSAAWSEIRQSVAQPPKDAVFARLELVNAASGTAYFDDVYFGPAEKRPQVIDARNGDAALTSTADGQITLRRGSTVLFRDLAAVGGAFRFDPVDPARWTDHVGSRKGTSVSGSGTSGKVSGESYDPVKAQWSPYSVAVEVPDGRYVNLGLQVGEDAALLGILPKEFVDEGIAVKTDTANFRLMESRTVKDVRTVTFGDRNRFEVSAADGAPAFRLVLLRTADGWSVGFGGAGALQLRIDTDSAALRKEDEDLSRRAGDAKVRRQFGEAVNLLRELAARLAQGSPQAAAAAEDATRLERTGQQELAAVESGLVSAIEFQDDAALHDLAARAAALSEQYAAHTIGAKAKEAAAAIREAQDKRRLVLHERLAEPLLVKADDCRDREDFALASALYHGIVDAYPGTEAAKKAQAALGKLPAGN